jgi:hypothetical protein
MGHPADAQDPQALLAFLDTADALLQQMVEQQHGKVMRLAREVLPHLSAEDLRNPWDFLELKDHPTFEYEDGLLNGLIAAQVALRAEFRQRLMPPTPPTSQA